MPHPGYHRHATLLIALIAATAAHRAYADQLQVVTDATWLTTDVSPPAGWNTDLNFDDSTWINAFKSPSGNNIWYGSNRSNQSPNQAWFRDTFTLSAPVTSALGNFFFDDNGENYLNGHLLIDDTGGGATSFSNVVIDPSWFVVGQNLFAIHGIDKEGPYSNTSAELLITTAPQPANLVWTGHADTKTWDQATLNWSNLGTRSTYSDLDNVTFDDTAPAANTLITVGSPVVPPLITIAGSTNSYTFTGSGSIATAAFHLAGTTTTTFQLPLAVSGLTTIDSGTLLLASTANSAAAILGYGNLTIAPAAALTSDGVTLKGTWTISGSQTIRPNGSTAGASAVNNLTLSQSAGLYTGKLDLTNNALILQATNPTDKANKISTLLSEVNQARNGTNNTWTGTAGITSSTVATGDHTTTSGMGLGVADAGDLPSITSLGTYRGQPVDTNSIIVVAAHTGDVTLDGRIDIADLNAVTSHWQMTNALWSDGDTTGGPNGGPDGTVTIADLNAVTSNWQYGTGSGLAPMATLPLAPAAPVPEPTSLALLALATPLLLRRKR